MNPHSNLYSLLEQALPQGGTMAQAGANGKLDLRQEVSPRAHAGSPDALAHLMKGQGSRDAFAALQSFQDQQHKQQQAQQHMMAQVELENLFNRLSHSSNSSATINGSSHANSASPVSSLHGDQNNASALPSSTVVSSQTDVMQAASCVNFALSQPNGPGSFVLQPQAGPHGAPGSQASLNTALRVAVSARKIHATMCTGADVDIALLPVLVATEPHLGSAATADGVELHVYRCSVPSLSATGPAAHTLRVDSAASPLVFGLQLAQLLSSALGSTQGCGVVDVVFGAACAKVGLQALTIARTHLSAAGQDFVLLPQQVEGANSAAPWVMRMLHSKLLVLAAPLTGPASNTSLPPTLSRQNTNGNNILGGSGAFSSHSYTHDPPSLSSLSDAGTPAGTSPMDPATPLLASTLLANGYSNAYAYSQQQAALGQLQQAALRGMMGGVPQGGGLGLGSAGSGLGLQSLGMSSHSNLGGLGGAAAMMAAAASAAATNRPRARKADWVIVTEDTAIKNAAGAVAKVLGRVAGAGLCCPVFTEKKTDKYTAVVSVAVKAIAVARGYVVNEGTGHEVAFQPYLRSDPTSGLGPRPPGAPVSPASSPPISLESLGSVSGPASLDALLSGVSAPPATLGLASIFARTSSSSNIGVEPSGGSGSSAQADDDSGLAEVERSEMAFDVYKVPQVPEAAVDSGALPVKVTAHSRPGVVSNIIAKLVHERESAVLITAGGRAMHVAMMAVVVARARLRARGLDVLLLPKFVTVDTTSTLGWESVFLRFHIIRAPIGGGQPTAAPPSVASLHAAAAVETSNRLAMFSRMSA